MSRILTINSRSFAPSESLAPRTRNKTNVDSRILSMRGKKSKENERSEARGSARRGLVAACFLLIVFVLFSGAFYLYQVNDLATKGYKMKEAENRIAELEKESKKMEIREVELRSMYNVEKSTQDLNLVNTQNISYVEMNSPVAMNR